MTTYEIYEIQVEIEYKELSIHCISLQNTVYQVNLKKSMETRFHLNCFRTRYDERENSSLHQG